MASLLVLPDGSSSRTVAIDDAQSQIAHIFTPVSNYVRIANRLLRIACHYDQMRASAVESRANTVESRSTTVESYATTIEPCAATIGFLKGRA